MLCLKDLVLQCMNGVQGCLVCKGQHSASGRKACATCLDHKAACRLSCIASCGVLQL